MKDFLRAVSVFLCIGFGWYCVASEAQQTPPKGIDVIWGYVGVWKIETEQFDTAHSKAGHEKATLRNACWKDGAYLACNQYVDGESKILIVFTYDAKHDVYTSYQIPADGGESRSGKLTVTGNTWTFPWQTTEDGKTTYFRVLNVFVAPDRIEYRQEYSTDQIHWTVTEKGIETKLSAQ